jgi:hypothetical protein
MRNDLPEAIEQYQLVAKNWPDSPEASQAQRLAQALRDPQAVAFYKDLYAYTPPKMTLPPLGSESLQFPHKDAPFSTTGPGAGSLPAEAPLGLPEVFPPSGPGGVGATGASPASAMAGTSQPDLPSEVFSPPATTGTKTQAAKQQSPR